MNTGFADLQVLLESGFKQLEKFYLETGGGGNGVSSCSCTGGSLATSRAGSDGSEAYATNGAKHPPVRESSEVHYRSAVEETMANLREETSAALERQRTMLDVRMVSPTSLSVARLAPTFHSRFS